MITIMLVSDQPIMRAGLRVRIRREADMRVVSEGSNSRRALRDFGRCKPDVTVIDLELPGDAGLVLMNAIRSISPSAPLVLLAAHADALDSPAPLAQGSTLVVPKTLPSTAIILAIRQAHRS